jgi:hypothetical protein
VTDIVAGIIAAANRIESHGYRVWNLGNSTPVTLSEKNRLYRRSKENDMELLVDILIMKATDEHGVKLFTIEHKPTLLNKADSNVVGRVAKAILADDAPKVDDLKN